MGFYDDRETANQYIKMAEGFDGQALVNVLREQLPAGASVLELGMGPGVDLDLLSEHFKAVGSDISQFFLHRYREKNPGADLICLDAVELRTDRVFDGIYSNKVLHHLSLDELSQSVRRQRDLLNSNSLILHSFWRGEGEEEHHRLRFVYQTEESLRAIFGEVFNVIEIVTYEELEHSDSLYLLAKNDN